MMIKKAALYLLIYFCLVNTASATSGLEFWDDVRYWVNVNNVLGVDPLRQEDLMILQKIESDGDGAVYSIYKSKSGLEIPQAVAAWAYLAELGVAIIRSEDEVTAKIYLKATEKTSRFYKERMFEAVPGTYGQGRMVNTPWYASLREEGDTEYPVNAPLPFNWSASFAYFNAVRNNMHKKIEKEESYYEVSAAFQIYQYLHTQMVKYRYDPQGTNQQFVKWNNAEHKEVADDASHGGLSARCLAYGAKDNYVWRWWTNVLFNKMRPIILSTDPGRIDMTGTPKTPRRGHHYWKLPY